ncbi:transmembrane protein 19 isoform X3 [Anabrus simplex]|uniref:transmembrane protein 19 isoform X3 n=1 Tax=Anabrus simplex TaxID=316456 RepID=UPI0035A294B5
MKLVSYSSAGSMEDEKRESGEGKSATCLPIFILALALPLSMIMWLGNLAFSFFTAKEQAINQDAETVIPPTRWLTATITPLAIAAWGLRKKSVDKSGAVLGLVIGFVLTLSSYCFFACLLTFFVTSSKATKFRAHKKRKMEEHFKEGGQRNWIQVLCNGGMATQLALLYLLDAGCEERPIDFSQNYRSSWLGLGVLGTNGGVTIPGLIFSLLGGAVIGLAYYITVLYCVDSTILAESPPQWPLVLAGAFAGIVGSLVDSLLGATLQYSGVDERTGCIVEHAGRGIKHISGIQLLDNHSVNLISSVVMGLLTPRLAAAIWH